MLRIFYRKESFAIISDSAKRELKYYGIKDEQIKIIYCGMENNFYIPTAEQRTVAPNDKYLLFIGRIQKYKGILDICEAFELLTAKYPELTLKVAGSGPFVPKLREWISDRNLEDKITLLGFISENEKLRLLQHAFLVVQPSYKEGWGLTVIEANACGVPVVANNAPGLCDSVSDGKTGLLYKFGDVTDAAAKIEEFLSNPARYAEFSKNCRPWAEKFRWETASDETLALMTKLCQD
jgi:glycosyltransferase involved in cell wall biosynthesis